MRHFGLRARADLHNLPKTTLNPRIPEFSAKISKKIKNFVFFKMFIEVFSLTEKPAFNCPWSRAPNVDQEGSKLPPSPALNTCQKKCQKSSKRHPLKIDSRERPGADLARPPMFKPHFFVERMFFGPWDPEEPPFSHVLYGN